MDYCVHVTSSIQAAPRPLLSYDPSGAANGGEAALRRFLLGLPGVDKVGVEARSARLGTRSIKTTAKAAGIDLAIRMIDLTTLEGADTPGKVRSLCAKARRPDPGDPSCPSVAAVCVYPDMVAVAKEALRGTGIHVAAVATAFPSGRASLDVKLADIALGGRGRRRRGRHGDRPRRLPVRPVPGRSSTRSRRSRRPAGRRT